MTAAQYLMVITGNPGEHLSKPGYGAAILPRQVDASQRAAALDIAATTRNMLDNRRPPHFGENIIKLFL